MTAPGWFEEEDFWTQIRTGFINEFAYNIKLHSMQVLESEEKSNERNRASLKADLRAWAEVADSTGLPTELVIMIANELRLSYDEDYIDEPQIFGYNRQRMEEREDRWVIIPQPPPSPEPTFLHLLQGTRRARAGAGTKSTALVLYEGADLGYKPNVLY